jgi:hypothetical protein
MTHVPAATAVTVFPAIVQPPVPSVTSKETAPFPFPPLVERVVVSWYVTNELAALSVNPDWFAPLIENAPLLNVIA